jgi:hypothetical protein
MSTQGHSGSKFNQGEGVWGGPYINLHTTF